MNYRLLLSSILLVSLQINAEPLSIGANLPPLAVKVPGEVQVNAASVSFVPWSTEQISAKPHVVQYIAGTMKASEINKPFQHALQNRSIDKDLFGVISIIDLRQSLLGTRRIITKSLVKSKKKHVHSHIVGDEEGQGLAAWGLQKNSSAVIVLNKSSEIVYFKDGRLDDEEIAQVLALLESLL